MHYLVRVELERQLPVRALDLLIGRARRDAENLKRVERPNLARAARVSMHDLRLHVRRKRTSSAALRMCTRSPAAKSQSSTRETLPAVARTRVRVGHEARALKPHAPNVKMPPAPADERPLRCFTACAPRGAALSA